jgi:hypothetical protein
MTTISGSVGGALGVAAHLAGATGAELALLARTAFVSGMNLGLLAGAGVPTAGALLALAWLPNQPHLMSGETDKRDHRP